MRKLATILLMAMLALTMSAQSFADLWKAVETAEGKDQPKSALETVQLIQRKAEKTHDYGNLLAALIKEMQMQREVADDSLTACKARLQEREKAWRQSGQGVEAALADLAMGRKVSVDSLMASADSLTYRKQGGAIGYAPLVEKGIDSKFFNNDLLSLFIIEGAEDVMSAEAITLLAKYYGEDNKVVRWLKTKKEIRDAKDNGERIALLDKAIAKWKDWTEVNELRNERNEMVRPSYTIRLLSDVANTQTDNKLAVSVRNVKEVTITLREVKGEKRVKKHSFALPNDYTYINDTISIGTLPLGIWTIDVASPDVDERGNDNAEERKIYVTDLKVIQIKVPKETQYVVVNAITGKEEREANLKKDKDGNIRAVMGNDTAMKKYKAYNNYTYTKPRELQNFLNIYTDRAIYRRGQTVHVSVLAHAVVKGKESVPSVSQQVVLTLRDKDDKTIQEKTVVTDSYGVAATDFALTEEGTNGTYRITGKGGSIAQAAIRVEDYKRPTYDVTFEKPNATYSVGDTLDVRGVAKTYSGVPVANAKVVYNVRRATRWFWCKRLPGSISTIARDSEEIANDTVYTDADGAFYVQMPMTIPADVDILWYYHYDIIAQATVTDTSGESHAQSITLPLHNDAPKAPVTPEAPKALSVSNDTFPEDGSRVTVTMRHITKDKEPEALRQVPVTAFYIICSADSVLKRGRVEFTDSITRTYRYKEEFGDGITMAVAWVRDGVMYRNSVSIKRPLPSKELKMEWSTFRNKLVPGQKETWTLKVTNPDGTPANAQLMAVLYDKSLEAIQQHLWQLRDNRRLSLPSMRFATDYSSSLYFYGNKRQKWLDSKSLDFSHIDATYRYRDFWYGIKPYYRNAQTMLAYAKPMAMSKTTIGYYDVKSETAAAKEEAVFDCVSIKGMNNGAEEAKEPEVMMRSDFAETAFFMPQLLTDNQGIATISFTLPESVTTWRFMALAHDSEMRYATMTDEAVAQKQLMVQAKMPRFLRLGDKATISSAVANLSDKDNDATVTMEVLDAKTEKVIDTKTQKVAVKAGQTAVVAFPVKDLIDDAICRFTAKMAGFADGEQHLLPVVTDKEMVVDTTSFVVNPVQMMKEALPALSVPISQNIICLANAYYANVMTAHLNDTIVSAANTNVLAQMLRLQNADGGFSWYSGMQSSKYMTIEVLKTLARLNVMCGKQQETAFLMSKAFAYTKREMEKEMADMKKYNYRYLSNTVLDWLYALAITGESGGAAEAYFRKIIYAETKGDDMQTKAVAAITMYDNGQKSKAGEFVESIKQHTVYRTDMGRYFDSYRAAYSWCDYRIPTHTMCIEAMNEVTPDDQQTINEMLRWLVQAKRTQRWDNPINAVNAIYALSHAKDTTVMSAFVVHPAELKGALTIKRELIPETKAMKVGDKVKVRLTITADRDYDFVTVTDNRAACLEPVTQLSGYRMTMNQSNGHWMGYYQEMRDSKSVYHMDQLSKGTHVIETEYYIDKMGAYNMGKATVKCEYAPEFCGETDGEKIIIE